MNECSRPLQVSDAFLKIQTGRFHIVSLCVNCAQDTVAPTNTKIVIIYHCDTKGLKNKNFCRINVFCHKE